MKKILILGAGFGGVRAALDLSKKLKQDKIVLVNDTSFHCYIPDLYELTSVNLGKSLKKNYQQVFSTVSIPLSSIFKKGVEVVVDRVLGVDLFKKEINLQDKGRVSYDYLVISLGSTTSYYHIPGAWEYSHPLKTVEDALNIRDDLSEMFSNKRARVVIAGGGFTGVELAGNLSTFLRDKGEVIVLEGMGNLLTGMPPWAQKKALNRLKDLKVDVRLKCQIEKVGNQIIFCRDGQMLNFDYLIWVTGVSGIEVRRGIKGAAVGKKNQFQVGSDLSLNDFPEVFVCGDMAHIYQAGGFVPATAWAAIDEGAQVAENIRFRIEDKKTKKFIPQSPAFVVPIGRYYAISNVFGLSLAGVIPWIMKLFIALRYFWSILPPTAAFKLWLRGVADLR